MLEEFIVISRYAHAYNELFWYVSILKSFLDAWKGLRR